MLTGKLQDLSVEIQAVNNLICRFTRQSAYCSTMYAWALATNDKIDMERYASQNAEAEKMLARYNELLGELNMKLALEFKRIEELNLTIRNGRKN